MSRRLSDDRGLTAIELLVGLVLSTAVLGLLTGALGVVTRTDTAHSDHSRALASLRTTVERLGKEARQARRIYTDSTCRQLHFWIDLNQDEAASPDERITWEIVPVDAERAELQRTTDEADAVGVPLVTDFVVADVFAYGNETTPPEESSDPCVSDAASIVVLEFTADVEPSKHIGPRTVRTEVKLRNVAA